MYGYDSLKQISLGSLFLFIFIIIIYLFKNTPPIHLSIYPSSIYKSILSSIPPSIFSTTSKYIYSLTQLLRHPSIHLTIYCYTNQPPTHPDSSTFPDLHPFHPSKYDLLQLPTHSCTYPSIHLPLCPPTYPSIPSFTRPSKSPILPSCSPPTYPLLIRLPSPPSISLLQSIQPFN